MKLDRMLAIIMYLVNHEKVKAQELADKFEVSVRTIYRDIDGISLAGIPIVAYQGADGGIGIAEGYKLDKSLLTTDEVFNIVTGLKGLHSISEDLKIKILIEKLTAITARSGYIPAGHEIMIDLSSWNKNNELGLRIQEIRKAIRERKIIEFIYYTNEELTERKVEPCVIVFKETNWYLYAFCLLREDFRLFKLKRMSQLTITDTGFNAREFSIDRVEWDGEFDKDQNLSIVVLFDKSMRHVADDIFGMDNHEVMEDGRMKVTFHLAESGWLYGFLLGFGDKIEILEPADLRNKIKSIAENVYKIYS